LRSFKQAQATRPASAAAERTGRGGARGNVARMLDGAPRTPRTRRLPSRAVSAAVALALGTLGATGVALAGAPPTPSVAAPSQSTASPGSSSTTTSPGSAPGTSAPAPQTTTTSAPPPPLRVLSWGPRGRAGGLASIFIRFSQPLSAADVRRPSLSPRTAGDWTLSTPTTLRFTPRGAYAPFSRVTVIVGRAVASAQGARLRAPLRFTFTIGAPSPTRLLQLLAQQGYLPLSFRPARQRRHSHAPGVARTRLQADEAALFAPPAGRLLFDAGWPASLHILWAHDRQLMVRGALMAFEAAHNLPMDGVAGPAVWAALERDQQAGRRAPVGYSYAIASESSPETLTVWHDGHIVLRSLANTGVPGAPTQLGTYPVYLRLRSQVMQGTNLDGSHYADPVAWVAYFNGGDAVHYFPRASFGYPQSLGCVELPYAAAEQAWGYLTYGTLVTVVP